MGRPLLAVTSLTASRLLPGRCYVIARWFPHKRNLWFVLKCLFAGTRPVWGDAEAMLARKPSRVLIDGFGNPFILEIARLAKRRGIPVYAIWHGPYYQPCKKAIFEHVDCVLSWGEGNEEWLKDNGVSCPVVRVGNPIA